MSHAATMQPLLSHGGGDLDLEELRKVVRQLGDRSDIRFTVIRPDGVVLADSDEDARVMDLHATRPEVRDALASGAGSDTRYSFTMQEPMMYAALYTAGGDKGESLVLRTAVSVAFIDESLNVILLRVGLIGLVVCVAAIGLSVWVARRISRPLENMTYAARRFARGEFAEKVPAPRARDFAQLSDAMNVMAVELNARLQTIEQQTRESEAILESMIEGVLALDGDGCIISVNTAAMKMLGITEVEVEGRNILEVSRSVALQDCVSRALNSQEPFRDDVVLPVGPEVVVQVQGTALTGHDGQTIGALIVMHDITHLRKLEQIRKEFVANVSHELKTPVTSIRGFVETLLDEDAPDPETTRRFLDIMNRQARRLSTIIEDLLSLSRIEKQEDEPLQREAVYLPGVVSSAVELCQSAAEQSGIRIEHTIDVSESVSLNGPLIEQALVNLIENGVKYSPEGTTVRVDVTAQEGALIIRVRDDGAGIASEHLPRLFERFYRVDKGRSRQVGGTGLGLAIVKHIVLSHGGTIHVESERGEGTCFTLKLPMSSAPEAQGA